MLCDRKQFTPFHTGSGQKLTNDMFNLLKERSSSYKAVILLLVIMFSYFGDMTSHFLALESRGILETFTNYATFMIPVDFFYWIWQFWVSMYTGYRLISQVDDPGLYHAIMQSFPTFIREKRFPDLVWFLLLTQALFLNSSWWLPSLLPDKPKETLHGRLIIDTR